MTFFIVLAVIVATLVTVWLPTVWQRRKPEELRGDWWPRFERDFRAYVRGMDTSDR